MSLEYRNSLVCCQPPVAALILTCHLQSILWTILMMKIWTTSKKFKKRLHLNVQNFSRSRQKEMASEIDTSWTCGMMFFRADVTSCSWKEIESSSYFFHHSTLFLALFVDIYFFNCFGFLCFCRFLSNRKSGFLKLVFLSFSNWRSGLVREV